MAPDTCPRGGLQTEPESLAPRSSAAFIIATVSASLRAPLRRWKSVPLELGWGYCAPQSGGVEKTTLTQNLGFAALCGEQILHLAFKRHAFPPTVVRVELPQSRSGRAILRDGARGDLVAKLGQFGGYDPLTPGRVLAPHPPDEFAEVCIDGRTARRTAGAPAPAQAPGGTVPADDGLGFHEEHGVQEAVEAAGQRTDDPAIESVQARAFDLAADDDELLAKDQILGDQGCPGCDEGQDEVEQKAKEADHGSDRVPRWTFSARRASVRGRVGGRGGGRRSGAATAPSPWGH
jgi:hypothetical protein